MLHVCCVIAKRMLVSCGKREGKGMKEPEELRRELRKSMRETKRPRKNEGVRQGNNEESDGKKLK